MGILSWIIVGLLAGLLARAILPGVQAMGWILTIVLGIVGALVGGFIMSLLGFGSVSGVNIWSIFVATIGAILVMWIVGMLRRG